MCIYIRFEATPEAAGFIPKQRHKTPSTRRVSYSRAAKGHVNVRFTTKTGIRALATRSGRGLWWCERLYCHCWANTIHGNDVARLNATTELQCLMCCICVCVCDVNFKYCHHALQLHRHKNNSLSVAI